MTESSTQKTKHRLKITTLFVVILLMLSACSAPQNNSGNTARPGEQANSSGSTQNNEKSGARSNNNTTAPETSTNNTKQDGTVLVETVPAGNDYIDETLFLGDSNTAMYLRFKDPQGMPYCTEKNTIGIVSMGIEHIESLKCMSFSTGVLTMAQSASVLQPRRIIIMFGTNDLKDGTDSAKYYAELYAKQISMISKAYPYADIIVNSVLPSTKNTSFITAQMNTIRAFNQQFIKMCSSNGWKYMNSFEAFIDQTGSGNPDLFENDGLHLNAAGVETMFKYIKTHALYTEDRRPAQRAQVPEIYGPLTEILAPVPYFPN